jgi:hypothetical protein
MAANRTVYHVVPNSDGEQWIVTQENSEFREEYYTRAGAVGAAKMRARAAEPSHVKVHSHDGSIEDESTYGDAPS